MFIIYFKIITMRPIKQTKYGQFNSQPHTSTKMPSQPSNQKLPKPRSLNKTYKQSPFPNPYLKKFNLRKIHRTEESVKRKSYVQQKSKNDEQHELMEKINASINLKKEKRFGSIRMHTQKLRNKHHDLSQVKDSPYKMKNTGTFLQTIDHQQIHNQAKYKHLTSFQRQQIHRYQVYYIGKRRINSNKCFTDRSGDAKVAAYDSIIYRYEILDIIGKGSFGQVFKAFDHKKKELVALKIIRNEKKFCAQAKVQIKILQHALIADPKNKSNIIQLKHGFFFRGHPCLVFQLLHQNLYQFMREISFKGLSQDLILRFGIQIFHSLLFLKRYQIIHCDLKPQNILIKQKNKTGIKIIDVGSGCFQNQQIYTYIQSRFYRAPQIIVGIPYTCAIDIWSVGCILCQLFLGYPAFPGQDQYQQMAMYMQVLGIPNKSFVEMGCRSKKFFIEKAQNRKQKHTSQDEPINQNIVYPKIKANKKGIIRKPGSIRLSQMLKCQNQNFIDFVSKCLVWNPEKRLTPTQALLHPWVLDGLPEQIRKQHIAQVKKLSYS